MESICLESLRLESILSLNFDARGQVLGNLLAGEMRRLALFSLNTLTAGNLLIFLIFL